MKVDSAGFEAAFGCAGEVRGREEIHGPLLFEAEATAWLKQRRGATDDDTSTRRRQPHATSRPSSPWTGSARPPSPLRALGIVWTGPFYAESGGQVADVGTLRCPGGALAVSDAKVAAGFVLHAVSPEGRCAGAIKVGDGCAVLVDYDRRSKIAPNHTMTHMLNHALRAVLGDEVDQKGSLVDDEKLRFDFSHAKAMTPDQIERVEAIVREKVAAKLSVSAKEVALAEAKAISGLRAVFGEVYPDPVRVVSVGPDVDALLADPANAEWKNASIEFCGGTHLANTADAEQFVLLSEEGIAKGIRRIVGATRGAAARATAEAEALAKRVAACGCPARTSSARWRRSRDSSTPRRFRRRTARGSATR